MTKFIYEKGDLIIGNPNRYRLKLRERDETFFREHIQDEKGLDRLFQLDSAQLTDRQKNIQANARYFAEAPANLSELQRIRLLQYLMCRCFLVVVSTPDLDSAYRIFSVKGAGEEAEGAMAVVILARPRTDRSPGDQATIGESLVFGVPAAASTCVAPASRRSRSGAHPCGRAPRRRVGRDCRPARTQAFW